MREKASFYGFMRAVAVFPVPRGGCGHHRLRAGSGFGKPESTIYFDPVAKGKINKRITSISETTFAEQGQKLRYPNWHPSATGGRASTEPLTTDSHQRANRQYPESRPQPTDQKTVIKEQRATANAATLAVKSSKAAEYSLSATKKHRKYRSGTNQALSGVTASSQVLRSVTYGYLRRPHQTAQAPNRFRPYGSAFRCAVAPDQAAAGRT